MNSKNIYTLLIIFIISSNSLWSQTESLTERNGEFFPEWQVGLFLGLSSYEGDVHCFKEDNINVLTEAHFAVGLNVYKNITPRFRLGFQYLNTKIAGSDAAFTSNTGHQARGFSFKNNINELSLLMQYEPFGHKSWRISPYIIGGISSVFGKANTNYNRTDQPSSRDEKIKQDINESTSTSLGFPLGVGLAFNLSDKVSLNLDATLRFGLNDYLDGVSNSGNSVINDYFGSGGLNIVYRFGDHNRKLKSTIKEY